MLAFFKEKKIKLKNLFKISKIYMFSLFNFFKVKLISLHLKKLLKEQK